MTGIEGIVTGYDGSPGSHEALRWAVWEAEARRAKLTVCLAWAPHYLEVLREERVYDLARQRGEEILEGGLQYPRSILGPGRVVPVLARRAAGELLCEQSRTAELVAVGSHGHGGVPGLHLGSVAWQLACRGHGPVVIARGQWVHPNQNPGPVVAGVDGSSASHAVLEFAFREAELRDAPLLAVCAQMDAPRHLRQCLSDSRGLQRRNERTGERASGCGGHAPARGRVAACRAADRFGRRAAARRGQPRARRPRQYEPGLGSRGDGALCALSDRGDPPP